MIKPDAFGLVAGGTVQASGGIYLERRADRELLDHCLAGNFTYVLTSRQMGKSSLMIRTAERLGENGVLPVIIDLTEFGAQATAEQWYKGLLFAVQDQLDLRTAVADWWQAHGDEAFAHRFTRYLREVVLAECKQRIVLFVDEIDTTLRLGFTDDFFASIRFLYQLRAAEPELQRLSFVLIGVATPGDLIKDAARTPFNVGHRIELTDFTLDEASALSDHLAVPAPVGREVIASVLRWTGGHPYLTLRVVRSLAELPPPAWTSAAVDERVRELFFLAAGENDSNLQFVRDMLTKKAFDKEAVLRTYGSIRRGERVADKELDQVASWLKLSGVVCRRNGLLALRNAIYEHVFNEGWARDHLRLNLDWRRRLARLATVLLVVIALVTIPLALFAWRQKTEAQYQAREARYQARLAQEERDEAHRQREIAERSLAERTAALETSEKALEALARVSPGAAARLSTEVASARVEAQKEIDQLTARYREERDEALRKLAIANQRLGQRADANLPPPASGSDRRTSAPTRQGPDETEGVRKALRAYESAYRSRDINALRRVQSLSPADAKAIAAAFADALDYRLTLDKLDIRLSPDGRRATVNAQLARVVTTRQRLMESTSVATFVMERRGGSWLIVAVQ